MGFQSLIYSGSFNFRIGLNIILAFQYGLSIFTFIEIFLKTHLELDFAFLAWEIEINLFLKTGWINTFMYFIYFMEAFVQWKRLDFIFITICLLVQNHIGVLQIGVVAENIC